MNEQQKHQKWDEDEVDDADESMWKFDVCTLHVCFEFVNMCYHIVAAPIERAATAFRFVWQNINLRHAHKAHPIHHTTVALEYRIYPVAHIHTHSGTFIHCSRVFSSDIWDSLIEINDDDSIKFSPQQRNLHGFSQETTIQLYANKRQYVLKHDFIISNVLM